VNLGPEVVPATLVPLFENTTRWIAAHLRPLLCSRSRSRPGSSRDFVALVVAVGDAMVLFSALPARQVVAKTRRLVAPRR
jgi:hypothetical protein